jgi:osmotically-inducible protein OsmY
MCLTAALVSGCETMTGKTAGQITDDATISAAVKSKLTAERASNFTRIDVDTTRGTVYLKGTVENDFEKRRAEEVAKEVDGVRDVVNELDTET